MQKKLNQFKKSQLQKVDKILTSKIEINPLTKFDLKQQIQNKLKKESKSINEPTKKIYKFHDKLSILDKAKEIDAINNEDIETLSSVKNQNNQYINNKDDNKHLSAIFSNHTVSINTLNQNSNIDLNEWCQQFENNRI